MRKAKENIIVHETFLIMCNILKERGGVFHREIASSIGIDTSLLSRWVKNNSIISKYYNDRIYEYLNQEKFSCFQEELKALIVRRLKINRESKIYNNIMNCNYTELLKYLFFGLSKAALDREERLRNIYFEMAKTTLIRKTMSEVIEGKTVKICENIFDNISPHVEKQCEAMEIANNNTIIIEVYNKDLLSRRILVLFSHDAYDHGDTSIDAKLEFILREKCLGRTDQFLMLTNPCHYISKSYQSFEYNSSNRPDNKDSLNSGDRSGVVVIDIENLNISKLERYVDFVVRLILDAIRREEIDS